MINVMLASNLFIMREGMKRILHSQNDINVIAEVAHFKDLKICDDSNVRHVVVIIQPFYYHEGSVNLLEYLLDRWPKLRIVLVTKSSSLQQLRATLQAGAHGLLSSTCAPTHLLDAIRAVNAGKFYLNEEISEIIGPALYSSESLDRNMSLTDRELDVLKRLSVGEKVSKIATDLGISPKTVSSHKLHIMEKTGVASFSELIQYAMKRGVVQVSER